MKKNLEISIGVLLTIGLTSCGAAEMQDAMASQQNLTSTIPYKIQKANGVSIQCQARAKGSIDIEYVIRNCRIREGEASTIDTNTSGIIHDVQLRSAYIGVLHD